MGKQFKHHLMEVSQRRMRFVNVLLYVSMAKNFSGKKGLQIYLQLKIFVADPLYKQCYWCFCIITQTFEVWKFYSSNPPPI